MRLDTKLAALELLRYATIPINPAAFDVLLRVHRVERLVARNQAAKFSDNCRVLIDDLHPPRCWHRATCSFSPFERPHALHGASKKLFLRLTVSTIGTV